MSATFTDGRLVTVTRVQFADTYVALDTDKTASEVYRLYQAALNRVPDADGVGYHIASMEVFGLWLTHIATQFMASPEFIGMYGNPTNAEFVTQLYRNVLHREPDAGGLEFHTNNLNAGRFTRAEVLIQFSESPENRANLAEAMARGVPYVPYQPAPTAHISPFGRR